MKRQNMRYFAVVGAAAFVDDGINISKVYNYLKRHNTQYLLLLTSAYFWWRRQKKFEMVWHFFFAFDQPTALNVYQIFLIIIVYSL